MKVKISPSFKKDLKKARKSGRSIGHLEEVINQIQNGCLDPK